MIRQSSIGGFSTKLFVSKPPEFAECPLCFEVLKDARQCVNGHCFCFDCISEAFKRSNECPICKVSSSAVSDLSKNLIVNRIIEDLTSVCPSLVESGESSNSNCQWTGPFHSRQQHYENCCDFYTVKCGNKGCGLSILRKSLPDHVDVCPFSLVPCDFCKSHKQQLLPRKDLNTHQLSCKYRPVNCPNNCSTILPFHSVVRHTAFDCPKTIVDCPLLLAGLCQNCPVRAEKSLIMQHLMGERSLLEVLSDLVGSIAQLKLENDKKTSKINTLQLQNNDLTQQLVDMQLEYEAALRDIKLQDEAICLNINRKLTLNRTTNTNTLQGAEPSQASSQSPEGFDSESGRLISDGVDVCRADREHMVTNKSSKKNAKKAAKRKIGTSSADNDNKAGDIPVSVAAGIPATESLLRGVRDNCLITPHLMTIYLKYFKSVGILPPNEPTDTLQFSYEREHAVDILVGGYRERWGSLVTADISEILRFFEPFLKVANKKQFYILMNKFFEDCEGVYMSKGSESADTQLFLFIGEMSQHFIDHHRAKFLPWLSLKLYGLLSFLGVETLKKLYNTLQYHRDLHLACWEVEKLKTTTITVSGDDVHNGAVHGDYVFVGTDRKPYELNFECVVGDRKLVLHCCVETNACGSGARRHWTIVLIDMNPFRSCMTKLYTCNGCMENALPSDGDVWLSTKCGKENSLKLSYRSG